MPDYKLVCVPVEVPTEAAVILRDCAPENLDAAQFKIFPRYGETFNPRTQRQQAQIEWDRLLAASPPVDAVPVPGELAHRIASASDNETLINAADELRTLLRGKSDA